MVEGLLDTSIIIDLLREFLPAKVWLSTRGQLGVTRIVWMEVIEGSVNKIKQDEAIKLLKGFQPIELTPSDFLWGVDQLSHFRLSNSVDTFDCLIAAASYRLKIPLFTTNERHFIPMIGKLSQRPY